MSDPLIRGAVVLSGRGFAVVWEVVGEQLVLLPILRPDARMAHDIELELADLVACAVTIPDAVIRPRRTAPAASSGHVVVGTVPGRTMCRVVHGLVRVEAEERTHDKWAAGERHRRTAAEDRCVNMTT